MKTQGKNILKTEDRKSYLSKPDSVHDVRKKWLRMGFEPMPTLSRDMLWNRDRGNIIRYGFSL